MKAARWYGRRDLRLEELSDPQPGPGEVEIAVHCCGICGTDLHEYVGGPILIPSKPHPLTGKEPPVTLGHEFAGEVVSVGSGVTSWHPGERVTASACLVCGSCGACRSGRTNLCDRLGSIGLAADGAFAERVVVPAYTLHHLPQGLSWEAGAFTEPTAVAVRACRQGRLAKGETAAVVGAGTIGLLVLQAARAHGAEAVYTVEPLPARRRLAEELGAAAAFEPASAPQEIHRATSGRRADVVFECSGRPDTVELAVRLAGKGGRVVLLGIYGAEAVPARYGRLQAHEKELIGSSAYVDEFTLALELLADGRVRTGPLVSERIGLRALPDTFARLAAHPGSRVKVLVNPRA